MNFPAHSPFFDLVVVGSGIAGLSCAGLGARAGARTLLLEAHDKPGGSAGDFAVESKWGRFCFPVGATAILGLEKGGLHAQIFERLGVEIEAEPIEALRVFLPDLTIDWPRDPAMWKTERHRLKGNRTAQEIFWKVQELIADAGWFALNHRPFLPVQKPRDLLSNCQLLHPKIVPVLGALPFSVGEILRMLNLQNNREFIALVTLALLITVQSDPRRAPLSNGMAGLDLWRHGAFHPRGGAGQIAWKLLEGLEKHGGQTRFQTRVLELKAIAGGWKISTDNGEMRARNVVWNGVLPSQFRAHSPAYQGVRWGAFNVYAAINRAAIEEGFPLHAHILREFSPRFPFVEAGRGNDIFLSVSLPDDTLSAPTGKATLNISTHVRLSDWAHLTALQYRARKRQWRAQLLETARIALPNLPDHTLFAIAATPCTWERYTLRVGGFVGGAPLSRRNANLRAQSVRTRFRGLFRVGDETFPGQGTLACALSGWNAWREIEKQGNVRCE